MSGSPPTAAAVQHLSDGIRDAVLAGPATPALAHPLPDLSMTHALFALRAGGRAARWANRATMAHPGVLASVLWACWALLNSLAHTASIAAPIVQVVHQADGTPLRDPTGHIIEHPVAVAAFASPAAVLATWVSTAAMFLTIGAVIAFAVSLATEPTHRRGADGRLRRVRGHTSQVQRRRGQYARLRVRRSGVVKDWKAAKRDARDLEKALTRVGAYRLRRYGRQWATEDAHGAERTPMRPIDRVMTRHVKPSKKAKNWGAEHRKAERATARRRRRELDAEWKAQEAAIRGRATARAQAGLAAAPRPGTDAAVPPVAPGSTAGRHPEMVALRTRALDVETDARRFVAELAAAQTNGAAPTAPPTTNGSEP